MASQRGWRELRTDIRENSLRPLSAGSQVIFVSYVFSGMGNSGSLSGDPIAVGIELEIPKIPQAKLYLHCTAIPLYTETHHR
jgi:hypothetical protein